MDEITIRGYKSIRDQTVEIRPINVLIGGNGAGKSNFISFFSFFRALAVHNLKAYVDKRGGQNRFLHNGLKEATDIYIKILFKENLRYELILMSGTSELVILSEKLLQNEDVHDFGNFDSQSGLPESEIDNGRHVYEFARNIVSYHFLDTGSASPFTKMSHIVNDSYYLYPHGDNLAAILYTISATNRTAFGRIIKVIQSIADYFLDFHLQALPEGFIRLQWRDRYSEFVYGPGDLSDGTLRFIALVVLLLQPNLPKVIIIDEPEIGLHPLAIAKLAGMIKQAAQRGSKVIIATQSTTLLNHFEPEDVITVDNVDGVSQFNRLRAEELEQWLENYTLGDLWSRNIIQGGQP